LAAYPLGVFKERMSVAMKLEAKQDPKTRAGLLMRLGFGRMIAGAPLAMDERDAELAPDDKVGRAN
jgi:hypothetical protein